jgi:hypothetical protein
MYDDVEFRRLMLVFNCSSTVGGVPQRAVMSPGPRGAGSHHAAPQTAG